MNGLKFSVVALLIAWYGLNAERPASAQVKNDPPTPPAPSASLSDADLADYYSDIRETPWFRNSSIRKHLLIDDAQFTQLNADYRRAWLRYNDGLRRLDPQLTDNERVEAREMLREAFHRDMTRSADAVLTDPATRQRFNQLYLQHRGPGALNDPAVRQRLELTDDQRMRYRQLDRDWNRRMAGLHRDYDTDSAQVLKRFNSNRTEIQEGLESPMTRSQQEAWHSLTGEPYEMSPDVYFQDSMKHRAFTK